MIEGIFSSYLLVDYYFYFPHISYNTLQIFQIDFWKAGVGRCANQSQADMTLDFIGCPNPYLFSVFAIFFALLCNGLGMFQFKNWFVSKYYFINSQEENGLKTVIHTPIHKRKR